ncbi:alanine--tRNA ligase [Candidatus Woesearchaeota archaeon]|nr:alanine--tRNA ligase [Candidatus Woesearchaeota archaeon]
MKSNEVIKKYLDFFKSKGHSIIPSAPLVPENDPTVLFTTAGMHPLVPFLLGEPHPKGKRLVNVQKCVRTVDIDEVGDENHLTFFQMLGNWSLGDYFKKEALSWSYEFLTKELKIPKSKLYVTCFKGDNDAPKDEEAAKIWNSVGVEKDHIFFLGKKDNWWGPAGKTGPCGPDSEMFYWNSDEKPRKTQDPENCKTFVEIWNDVFMEYNKLEEGKIVQLNQKNVDTGMGVERVCVVLQNKKSVYETDLFEPIIKRIRILAKTKNERSERIIADHVRAVSFILAERVLPSNVEQGYVLRKLIRRAYRHAKNMGIEVSLSSVAEVVIKQYSDAYPELNGNEHFIFGELEKEEEKFQATLEKGLREFERNIGGVERVIPGKFAFDLYQSFGFPLEIIKDLAQEKKLEVDEIGFYKELTKHQSLSRASTERRFASGLADHSYGAKKLHTSTHLLHQALRLILGEQVQQKGSNITPERLRFDFTHHGKMTKEEIKKVENLVNKQINDSIEVVYEEMPLDEAKKSGALHFFDQKYPDKVKVYSIGRFSKEFCTGPHVENTSELGKFKIVKEEGIAAGIRRIKAVLE